MIVPVEHISQMVDRRSRSADRFHEGLFYGRNSYNVKPILSGQKVRCQKFVEWPVNELAKLLAAKRKNLGF